MSNQQANSQENPEASQEEKQAKNDLEYNTNQETSGVVRFVLILSYWQENL